MFLSYHITTRRQDPEDLDLNLHLRGNLKSDTVVDNRTKHNSTNSSSNIVLEVNLLFIGFDVYVSNRTL